MEDHLRVYAAYLWELCTAVVLPFEFVTVADQFIERLEELKPGAEAVGLDGAASGRARVSAGGRAARPEAEDWRARYAAAAGR